MKKSILIILTIILCSCTSLDNRMTTSVYKYIEADTPVYLRSLVLEPPHILNGIADELPGLIRSCLLSSGFQLADHPGADSVNLDVFLHRKQWHLDFNTFESVTLRLELSSNGEPAAYLLYTEDTDRSIDSFPWTFSLLEQNIRDLAVSVSNED